MIPNVIYLFEALTLFLSHYEYLHDFIVLQIRKLLLEGFVLLRVVWIHLMLVDADQVVDGFSELLHFLYLES